MITCPNCGNQAGEGAIFCDRCGTRLPAAQPAAPSPAPAPTGGSVICPSCNAPNVPGEAFCDYCGAPLEAPTPVVEAAPAAEAVSAEADLQAAPATGIPAAVEATAAEAKPTCPACGAEVLPGEAFCADCGASLAQPPIPPGPVPEVETEPVAEQAPPPVPPLAEAEPVVEEAPPVPVVAEAPPPPPPTPAPAPALTCPACGAEVEAGDAFCSSCGALLKAAPAAVTAPAVEAPPSPPPPLATTGPRLVVAASGAEIPLPAVAEMFIGREDPVSGIFPEVELTPHGGEEGGVSRRHARLIVEGGNYSIEDLDSTNFTFVNKQKLTPKVRQPLKDGDEIRCGRVTLILKTGS